MENLFKELKPLFIRKENSILKTMDVYLEREKNVILIDALAIEDEKKTAFLAMISGRNDGVELDFIPRLMLRKQRELKDIAELAKQLIATFPELRIGETNLENYLK